MHPSWMYTNQIQNCFSLETSSQCRGPPNHTSRKQASGVSKKRISNGEQSAPVITYGLDKVEKSQICKICRFYHFGAGRKAVSVRSLTFEQRQIEDCSFQQSWPISCALQLCCWDVDLKLNSFGSTPLIMKKQQFPKIADLPDFDRFRFLTSPGGYFQARGFFFGSNGLYWSPEHT